MLTGLLLDFVGDYQTDLPENGQELCMDLVDVSEKLRIHANRRLGNRKIILNDVSALGQIFGELVDALLMKRIQVRATSANRIPSSILYIYIYIYVIIVSARCVLGNSEVAVRETNSGMSDDGITTRSGGRARFVVL